LNNPLDILLLLVYVAYVLVAFVSYFLMRELGYKGMLLGLMANSLVHLNLILNGERLALGQMPSGLVTIKQFAYLLCINLLIVVGTWLVLGHKERSRELPTAIGLLISSIFFWEFYIPALFALVILALPERENQLIDLNS
jgi:hypothetical protein